MKALTLKELELELGDILVCESDNSCMFTHGCEYEVEQAEDGKLGVNTDCGFLATTSASLFTKITNTHSDSKLPSGTLNEWPTHELKRKGVRCGELSLIGAGYRTGKSTPAQILTQQINTPIRPTLDGTRA